jgi:hypothetical protein
MRLFLYKFGFVFFGRFGSLLSDFNCRFVILLVVYILTIFTDHLVVLVVFGY